ncbi:NCK-interacting protein with SH3 domain isoform X2 [Anabrus simplex]|uniref:NCK-interacting protein with SH3 domain isoform X2 n=1 Tax=Anabrus simplex TaxID=316456 RepID=UPI0035A364E3
MEGNIPEKEVRLDTGEMLKAMYDFKATFAKTLSFKENDLFILHHANTKQRNWWQVINSKGQVGYVPSNYVTVIQVSPQFLVEFLERCLESLREESARSGDCLPPDRQELLLRLLERRRQADVTFSSLSKGHGPCLPPDLLEKVSGVDDSSVREPAVCRRSIPTESPKASPKHSRQAAKQEPPHCIDGPEQTPKKTPKKHAAKSVPAPTPPQATTLNIDDLSQAAYRLVDQVRRHTQLSHEMSRVAVTVVISSLREMLPPALTSHLNTIITHVQGPLIAPQPIIEETHDARRLQVIFNELTSCKDDSQQRSWMLYEDEPTIIEYIKELTSILSNADSIISRHVMAKDQYNGVSAMVQYYQMEVRWSIRQLLLQAFGIMCSLDAAAVTLMLNSVLPMELARDMRSNPRNIPRLNYSSLLLTMIFSMGEPMPVTHLEYLGTDFISFLFDLIESPPDTDVEEQIPDLFLNLILSYNLQFKCHTENIVLRSLLEKAGAKTFTEKILLLLNREEDPVRIFEHKPAPPHSVLKLFIDLFSNDKTGVLFYTNDIKVLIDIIVRQLADLSPGDKFQIIWTSSLNGQN